ncbi:MAG: transcription-repair coupling factor, partial [Clostridiales bacterium]|nr:transcription-repair coupling factor [Clostridiales bacterium]
GARAAKQRAGISADIEKLREGASFPAVDKYIELCYEFETAAHYLPENAIVMISEPGRTKEAAIRAEKQMADDCVPLLESGALESSLVRFGETADGLFRALEHFPVIMADAFTTSQYPLQPKTLSCVLTKQLPSYGGSLETAAGDIAHYCSGGYGTVITVSSKTSADVLAGYLGDRGIRAALDYELKAMPEQGTVSIAVGALSSGVEYPGIKLAVLTEGQFTGARETSRVRKVRKRSNREKIQSFTDLTPGDLVVHEHHGIGRFAGVFQIPADGVKKDYVKIGYAGSDSLYIPVTQLDVVSKYIGGGEDSSVRLSKMGGAEWTRAKSRARASAKNMARELTRLYAERQRIRGHAFDRDSIWQTEFEEKFGYAETDDQVRCVAEIKNDMERAVPMDRLLCGDVGYGKTEVALRAVMKSVLGGRQAAVLVPTTVLARQHYITAQQRFAGYPVNIEVLSRFRGPAEIKTALKNIRTGTADIVIGTHRLLQKDVEFKELGLVVVDEEQRFGVSHKERLKEITKHVDVLTLSATPIPRTLNMALSGIRDMSLIEEPPSGRQPVQTYVIEHDWEMLADARRREVARGGQVYYLHNRIETIDRTASRISRLLNSDDTDSRYKVAVATAHGRMDEAALSDVMERVSEGEVSVLVCTTIIETGIDIPNVNTLIIEDADRMGLSQLHQIRGRVGRSPRRAFAYLTFRRGKVLSEIATKRLGAIREFAEFNSGFKIAMRDLEIRGAGNLLGSEQSGHMMKVGYDMYLKLLEEAVLEERGEKPKKRAECAADIAVSALLPEAYVPSGAQRVDLYRRIARVRTEEDAGEMIEELIDRYGDPPPEAVALVRVAKLRAEAAECGIAEITQKAGKLRLRLFDFDMSIISQLYSMPDFSGRIRVEAGSEPAVSFSLKTKDVLGEAERFIKAWSRLGAAADAGSSQGPGN